MCSNFVPKEVVIIPPVNSSEPAIATCRKLKRFNKGPFISPIIIPKATFVVMMIEPSVADKFNSENVTLKISPKHCMIGMNVS